ncbi:hypothetical protein [Planococcus sp. 4-30]|uniref:hypothetical protein n=1 Tax=Planococcus sp. 4-30 TaxID=2874583 RepID=UPI001CBE39BD|nr:hypothetical protein [Planococcus sp. 4-30]
MNYAVSFVYQSDDFEISVGTNHVFEAKNRQEAMEKATTLQQLSDYFTPYYATAKEDIVFDVIENEYFDHVFIFEYEFYDETKGDYQSMTLDDGKVLYPVMNPACYVKLDRSTFLQRFKEHYRNKEVVTFGSISYGVEETSAKLR